MRVSRTNSIFVFIKKRVGIEVFNINGAKYMRVCGFGLILSMMLLASCGDDGDSATSLPEDRSSEVLQSSGASDLSNDSSDGSVKSTNSAGGCNEENNCLLDARDGQTYRTVKIGNQVWMAQNLNYAYLQPTSEWDSSSFCYNDSIEYCEKYGRLYLWSAAMDSATHFGMRGEGCGYASTYDADSTIRGVCPEGWHLPCSDEIEELFSSVGGRPVAGSALKSTTDWDSLGNGIDSFLFTALPAGYRYSNETFEGLGLNASFWTTSQTTPYISLNMGLFYDTDTAHVPNSNFKSKSYSVRCLKDSQKESGAELPGEILREPCKTEAGDFCERDLLVDERDGQTYKTVKIGHQWWMAENLNYAYMLSTDSLDSSSFCYNNSPEYCEKYGRLYPWAAAIDSAGTFSVGGKGCDLNTTCVLRYPVRGLCPEGWHIPNENEWFVLIKAMNGSYRAGKKLKSTDGWIENGNGIDGFSFTVLPAGGRLGLEKNYRYEGEEALFWTSSRNSGGNPTGMTTRNYSNRITQESAINHAISIRCIKDDESLLAESGSLWPMSYATPCKTTEEDDCEYGTLTDERDGQTYKTVKIGDQWWMAQNLNFAYLQPTSELDSSSFCYNGSSGNCEKYGRLYLWSAAMDSAGVYGEKGKGCGDGKVCSRPSGSVQGVCPKGWHLPDSTDWSTLFAAVGGRSFSGKSLKSTSGWKRDSSTNAFGFSVLPAGLKQTEDWYAYMDIYSYISSSMEQDSGWVRSAYFDYTRDGVSYQSVAKNNGASVRCLKD